MTVSKGPSTSAVPGRHVAGCRDCPDDARGRRVPHARLVEDTDDQSLDGIVLSQDPVGGKQAKPNSLVTLFVGRFVETTTRQRRPREPTRSRGRARGRPLERARDLTRRRRVPSSPPSTRAATRPSSSRSTAADAGSSLQAGRSFSTRASRRSRSSPTPHRPRRSARSTSCSRSSTGRSARTAPCRASSSSPASPTSARASPPPRCAWTRTSSRRCSETAGSRSRRNVTLRDGDEPEHPFDYPVFVKPARLGSSVGISKVHDASELARRRRAGAPPRRQGADRGGRRRGRGRVRRARQP